MLKLVLNAVAIAAHATLVTSNVVYWQNHFEPSDFVIASGDTLVLRGNNSVTGVLTVSAGATLTVDPAYDTFFSVGTIDVAGDFRIGTSATPYAKQAVFELACNSPFLAPDLRRKAVVVRENGTIALVGAKATGPSSRSWTKLRDTAQAGDAFLNMDLPTGWAVGDTIIIPSTDFDPHQAEKRTIVGVTATGVQLDRSLQFMHYGRVSEGVDERAEVGLLSRSIVFRGCRESDNTDATTTTTTSDVGGHMIFLAHFQQVHVEGIELQNFGQGDQLGRYAMHFHLCGQVPSDTILKSNAIHDSNFRAIVIHGTQGVQVEKNVAYNITGHAIMFEDGAETGNTLRHNLIVLVREKLSHVRLGSDAAIALSAFYITNPNNTITDNVVAGVEGTAFWIDTRLEVKGLSSQTGLYDGLHPFLAPLGEIVRNAAHSVEVGFKIESPNLDALDSPQQKYSPPYTYQPATMPVLGAFLVHHSRQGGWFRSYQLQLDNWIVGDVTEGVQILSRGDTSSEAIETYVSNSLFVGGTANRGNLVESPWQFVNYLENRSDCAVDRAGDARMAIKLYDGPMYITNCTFRLWYSQPCLNVTNPAIGTRLFNSFLMATAIVASDLVFDRTDVKLDVSDRQGDGGVSTSMVDKLGAISGLAGATLLPDWEYYATPLCVRSLEWGLACPQRYVNLDVVSIDPSTDPTRYGKLTVYRNNVGSRNSIPPSLSFSGQYIPASSGWLYHPIVSPEASYTLQFQHHTPDHLHLRFSYTKAGDVFRMVVAYPAGAQITSVTNQDGEQLSASSSRLSVCVNCFWFDAEQSVLSLTIQERAGPATRNASCSPLGCLTVDIHAVITPSASGISTAQINSIFPLVMVTDDTSDWRRQPFAYESATVVESAVNTDWCKVDDPCLHAIDEGNAKMGVLAFAQSPCVGVGCFSNSCRYCKLTFSAANVPFPGCPFDPNYVPPPITALSPCAAYASIGNSNAGVEVIQDATCVNGGGVNGRGCITDTCRFCQTKVTPQSSAYLNCSVFTALASALSSTTSGSVVLTSPPSAPLTAAATCQRLVSPGDLDAGISALVDQTCRYGGLGCFTKQCRFCTTRTARSSNSFMACSQTPASIALPPTTLPPIPDSCWLAVSLGDAAVGLAAIADASCSSGGLGCLSSACRFCSVRPTPQSTPYMPCNSVKITGAAPVPVPVVVPLDSCTGLVSSGDVAAGITAVTQTSCRTRGGIGCVTASCRYCKTRTTTQSAHLLNCSSPEMASYPGTRQLMQETASEPAAQAVTPVDVCSYAVSLDENVAGIFGVTDHTCKSTNTNKPAGCFADSCRYCRTADAVDLYLDGRADNRAGERMADWSVCPLYVVASSIGDSAVDDGDAMTTFVSSAECAAHVSFGDAQSGISAFTDASCTDIGSSDTSGCFARARCRYCKYRDTPRSESLQTCPTSNNVAISTPTPPSCAELPAMLALPSNISAIDEPRCNAEGHTLRGCLAFSSCRLCTTSTSVFLPRCEFMATVVAVRLASGDDEDEDAAPSETNGATTPSWSPIIVCVVGAACAVAVATIVAHKRVRPPQRERVRIVRTRSLPRFPSDPRMDVATLSQATSDATSDFFVL